MVPAKLGILRASTFQSDPRFSKYEGKQSIANAVSALAMLRLYKSKQWTTKILDDILKTGEKIYHDTKKNRHFEEPLKTKHITEKITIEERDFTAVIDDLTIIGKLQSTTDGLLDLAPAVRELFTENDAAILVGPVSLALWIEDGFFYMFDPEERDPNGLAIVRTIQIGSEVIFKDLPP